jgi:hypothetical protein
MSVFVLFFVFVSLATFHETLKSFMERFKDGAKQGIPMYPLSFKNHHVANFLCLFGF